MSVLKLKKDNEIIDIPFSGTPILRALLETAGVAVFSPCGGKGRCGKCAVKVSGDVSSPNPAEIKANCRLACQTVLFGDAEAELLCNEESFAHIEAEIGETIAKTASWQYAAAIDIGTTTVALKLFAKDAAVAEAAMLNPQRSVALDVIGRIDASLRGKADMLKSQITDCIETLLHKACNTANISAKAVEQLVITGNTAMLYLLCGYDPESIARAPFQANTLFGKWIYEPIKTYLPPCMNAFVGGDITCAVLASGMCENNETALLCDIGTNGEIALWKNGRLYVTSTAAGPAFEGAEIENGCGYVFGAVDKVGVENGVLRVHTVGDMPAKGICGSGLIDAAAAFLELGYIDETGAASSSLRIADNVFLTQKDIRALQLAKGAVSAGIEIMLSRTNTSLEEVKTLYLAGGFGNHLNLNSASAIGLVPRFLVPRAKAIGNAALKGATMMLFDNSITLHAQDIAMNSEHIELGGNADFNEAFIRNISFCIT